MPPNLGAQPDQMILWAVLSRAFFQPFLPPKEILKCNDSIELTVSMLVACVQHVVERSAVPSTVALVHSR